MKKIYSLLFSVIFFCSAHTAWSQTDAGISALVEPSDTLCPGSSPVRVVLHNYGPDSLTSVTVQWMLDSVMQTPYNFTDTLTAGSSDTLDLGNVLFAAATRHIISAWTENPNNGTDADMSNDTTTVDSIVVFLSGTYTIGGVSPDFAGVAAAVTALNNFGVCGPVIFDIRPMSDTIKTVLNAVAGASAVNTITFRSATGDSASVILTQPSANFGGNDYLIRLNSADHINFYQLTMQRTGTSNLQHVIDFTGGASANTVSHCRIRGGQPLGTSTMGSLLYSSAGAASNDSSNSITENLIEGGSYGVYLNGLSGAALESGNVVSDNLFLNQVTRAIHLNFQRDPHVERNRIVSTSTNTAYAGIYLIRNQGAIVISKNKVESTHGFGLYLNVCVASAITPALITNNFFSAGDSAAIRVLASSYMNILNNSALMKGTGLSAMYISGAGSGNIIENNILANDGGGFSFDAGSFATSGVLLSDYNNLYTTGASVGSYGGTPAALLSDWVTATGQDNNSVSMDPEFVSLVDLHATSAAMDNLAQPLGYVTDDIDGEARSLSTPDIGADEYSAGTHDLAVTALVSPADSSCGSLSTDIAVVVSNPGSVPAGGFDVIVELSGMITTTVSTTHLGTIQPGESDTVVINAALNTEAGGILNWKAYADYSYDDNRANDTLSGSVTILYVPQLPVVLDSGICGPGIITLFGFSPDTLVWYDVPAGGTELYAGNPFTTPFLTSTAVFYVSARNICESNRAPVTAAILPIPSVFLGNDTITGDSIVLDAGAGFSSYAWSTSDTTQTITVHTSGTYSVQVTDLYGCTGTDTIVVTVLTGIRDLPSAGWIRIYPIPAKEIVTVETTGITGTADLIVTNSLGQVVYHRVADVAGRKTDIGLAGWAPGIYSLEMRAGSMRQTARIVVQP